jgi:hypothetical protein
LSRAILLYLAWCAGVLALGAGLAWFAVDPFADGTQHRAHSGGHVGHAAYVGGYVGGGGPAHK